MIGQTVFVFFLLCACGAMAAFGQQAEPLAPIVTDRPDFTESAVVVPRGHIQLESGLTWLGESGGIAVFTTPEILIRWTPVAGFELRFGFPDYINTQNHVTESGFGDSSVGAKVQLGLGGDWDLASIAALSLPTGDNLFTTDRVDPGLIVMAGRDLGDTWSIGSQLSADWVYLAGDRSFFWGGTVVFGKSLGEPWGMFFEVAFTVPERAATPVLFHTGATHLVTPNLQLDVHGGVGLTAAAPDHFVGAGISARR